MTRNTHDLDSDHHGTFSTNAVFTDQGSDPAAGATGTHTVYTKAGGVYVEDPSGTVVGPLGTGGGGVTDLLTGNDSTFAVTLGSWTNSGGTLTRDTGTKMTGFAASAKFVATAGTQYIEVPVAGTFTSSTRYWVIALVNGASIGTLGFGLIGTDALSASFQVAAAGAWTAIAGYWEPTANRTGVKVRLTAGAAETFYTGWVKVFASIESPTLANASNSFIPIIVNAAVSETFGPYSAGGMTMLDSAVRYEGPGAHSGMDFGSPSAFLFSEHAPGSLANAGIEIEVGNDYVGLWISEKNSTTIQIYDDAGGSYDIELVDQGTKHWRSVDASAVVRDLSSMESRKGSGTATVATGTTSFTVTHGAGYTPVVQDISVCPTNNPTNDPGWFWVDTITSTQFNINVRSDPGASGAIFAWRVDR